MSQPIFSRLQAFTTIRQDLVTALLSLWLIAGIVVDGWAHVTRGGVESFFTLWHALFYSGFLAVAAWLIYLTRSPATGPGVPTGYRLGISGLVIFAAGGVGDLIWHQIFGIEVSIDALISPTHLLLLLGSILIISSPIRAAWHRPSGREGGWPWQGPALLAATLVAVLAQFFFLYISGWTGPAFQSPWEPGEDRGVALGMASLFISTVIFTSVALVMVKRFSTPFGFHALLVGAMGLAMGVIGSETVASVGLAAVFGGLGADLIYRSVRPSPANPTMTRVFALLLPLVVWVAHLVVVAIAGDLAWPLVLWLGAIMMMGFVGLGLGVVSTSPPAPSTLEPEQAASS